MFQISVLEDMWGIKKAKARREKRNKFDDMRDLILENKCEMQDRMLTFANNQD